MFSRWVDLAYDRKREKNLDMVEKKNSKRKELSEKYITKILYK